MGARDHALVLCVATAPPDHNSWFSIVLWIVSLLRLLVSIGREALPPSSTPTRQTRQLNSRGSPFTPGPTRVNNTHRTSLINSEPIRRGPTERTNGSASSNTLPSSNETTVRARSGRATTREDGPSQSSTNDQNPNLLSKPVTRFLFYGAQSEKEVFISDMNQFAGACHRYLGSQSQVDGRVVRGDIGFEFQAFFRPTNVRVQDMFIFGASGHGRISNNLVMFRLSADINIRIRDIFMVIDQLPFHCTIEIFLDICHAAMAAEQHGLHQTWPADQLSSTLDLRDGAVRPRRGPKVILWTAAGRQGFAYFAPGKKSYMLGAMCKVLKVHGPNITRRELYKKIVERLERLNERQRRKNKAPQIPVIFSSVANRDRVLDGYALQPLLSVDEQEMV
ncbi:unnamed protein product [Rhizoctonia solani]|uniref:Uncharacterized protein n=1 Tax=Rhizoctonia solani TaxID=456999 RepID=A0A8H3E3N8_9AGAM|nr:unnamed protein product [Rhizoctonia solani]